MKTTAATQPSNRHSPTSFWIEIRVPSDHGRDNLTGYRGKRPQMMQFRFRTEGVSRCKNWIFRDFWRSRESGGSSPAGAIGFSPGRKPRGSRTRKGNQPRSGGRWPSSREVTHASARILSPLRGYSCFHLRFPGLAPRAMYLSPLRGFPQVSVTGPWPENLAGNRSDGDGRFRTTETAVPVPSKRVPPLPPPTGAGSESDPTG